MSEKRPLITLTTDFGEADYFVAAVKGALLCVNPSVDIVDVTHQIPPHDVYSAAFTIMCCYRDFPRNALHVVVVDPGVGSKRRPIMVMVDGYNFIGPDNGVFSYIYQRENVNRVVHFNEPHYFHDKVAPTFHGRDIFAPLAGYVSKLVDWSKMGVEIDDPVRFSTPTPVVLSDKQIRGTVIHVDRFGNIITNISETELTPELVSANPRVRIGKFEAARLLTHFAEANPSELFAYFGSAGFLEIATPRQSAARLVEARRGLEVDVILP